MAKTPSRHPFLDDLADHVVLVASVLRRPVAGREAVVQVIKAGASQYLRQTPRFLDHVGERSYFEYDIDLHDGLSGTGTVVVVRDANEAVVGLTIGFAPLDVVLSIASGVRAQLTPALEASYFL